MRKAKKTYKSMEDEVLIKAFHLSPNRVIEEVYTRYAHLCFGLSLKYLKDREKAKDAVSEIFIKLGTDIPKHDIQNFRPWFYVFSKNHCLGILRKEIVIRKHEERWEQLRDKAPYADHKLDMQLEEMEVAIDQLKDHQRTCLQAFYFDKQSYVEISEHLQISIQQVKSNLQNGKRNLRLLLEANQSSNRHD